MAKGASSKTIIINKILEVFEDSFLNDKELRIPMMENGERVEIKVTLTCAKENVGGGAVVAPTSSSQNAFPDPIQKRPSAELTKEEVDNINNLVAALGL